MKQKINLLTALPTVKRIYLPCLEIRRYIITFFVILVLYSGYTYWKDSQMGNQLQILKQRQSQKVKELANLSKQLPPSLKASDADLSRIENEIEHHQKLVAVFDNQKHLNEEGFSAYLDSLAKNITSNTWLTEFDISQNGKKIELNGNGTTTSQIFKFLNNLDDAPTFRHVQFKIEALETVKNESGQVLHEFKMETANA